MRYIDADKLIEALQLDFNREGAKADEYAMKEGFEDISIKYSHGQFCFLNAIGRVKDTPTADVVPKSEVERLIGKFECFLCHVTGGRLSKHTYDLGTMESVATDCINETYNDGYGEGYKECARELFDEIYEDCFDQFGYIDYEKLAELKKKYTEEK